MQERIENHENRIKRLEQRQTEEIQTAKIEPGSIHNRLDNHAELMREQEQTLTLIYTDVGHMKTDIGTLKQDVGTLKTDMTEVKADVSTLKADMEQVKTTLNGHAKYFEEHGKRLSKIEIDVSGLKTSVDSIKSTQEQILKLLQERDK